MRRLCLLVVGALSVLGAAVPAVSAASARRASPFSIDTSGTCEITACRLDRAVAVAQPGEEVLLEAGTYTVNYRVRATAAVVIRSLAGGSKPLLQGASSTNPTLELSAGGVVSGLRIESDADVGLQLAAGAKAFGMEVLSGPTSQAAVRLLSAPDGTALVNSLAHTKGTGTAVDALDGTPAGGVSVVNVTAIATGNNSWGVTTDLGSQSPVVRNSIVRATAKTLHGRSGTMPILASYSNFTSAAAANYTDVAGNQKDVPVTFTNEALADMRPVAGAPTIEAAATDPLTDGTLDPDGKPRSLGSAPDIGAYEFGTAPAGSTGTATGGTTSGTWGVGGDDTTFESGPTAGGDTRAAEPTELAPAAPPVLGKAVAIEAAKGSARVRLPGARRFLPLVSAAAIPVGSTIDATSGHVRLTSVRDAAGSTQTGEFWGGVFVVRQARTANAYTDLVLRGGTFAGCPRPGPAASRLIARAAAKRRKRRSVVRKLWGRDDRGHFRTHGQNTVVTVRGTVWLVSDRCDGTLTRVREGSVVARQRGHHAVTITAGHSHLAKRRARR